jgi:hypothetical protein
VAAELIMPSHPPALVVPAPSPSSLPPHENTGCRATTAAAIAVPDAFQETLYAECISSRITCMGVALEGARLLLLQAQECLLGALVAFVCLGCDFHSTFDDPTTSLL